MLNHVISGMWTPMTVEYQSYYMTYISFILCPKEQMFCVSCKATSVITHIFYCHLWSIFWYNSLVLCLFCLFLQLISDTAFCCLHISAIYQAQVLCIAQTAPLMRNPPHTRTGDPFIFHVISTFRNFVNWGYKCLYIIGSQDSSESLVIWTNTKRDWKKNFGINLFLIFVYLYLKFWLTD